MGAFLYICVERRSVFAAIVAKAQTLGSTFFDLGGICWYIGNSFITTKGRVNGGHDDKEKTYSSGEQ